MRPPFRWLRADAGPIVCGRKFCTGCGRWRHVIDFGHHSASRYGIRARCRTCTRRYEIAYWSQPDALARRRESQRFHKHAKRRARGVAQRRTPYRLRFGDGYLDSVAPYGPATVDPALLAAHVAQWLAAYDAQHIGHGARFGSGAHHALAVASGVPERRIYGVLHGERCHRVTADRLACAIGLPLATIYGAAA